MGLGKRQGKVCATEGEMGRNEKVFSFGHLPDHSILHPTEICKLCLDLIPPLPRTNKDTPLERPRSLPLLKRG